MSWVQNDVNQFGFYLVFHAQGSTSVPKGGTFDDDIWHTIGDHMLIGNFHDSKQRELPWLHIGHIGSTSLRIYTVIAFKSTSIGISLGT